MGVHTTMNTNVLHIINIISFWLMLLLGLTMETPQFLSFPVAVAVPGSCFYSINLFWVTLVRLSCKDCCSLVVFIILGHI